jgi:uncharacterized membrane protein
MFAAEPSVHGAVRQLEHEPTRNPAKVLATTGGAALLLGLICFVAYAIEQEWLSPGFRFAGAALLSALLTMAAWPLARRGHESVAGAIGGAGLGGWFAAWLFARHAHELVSGPQVFVALGVGAAACLLIADRLKLRLMAVLATVAACATPLFVATFGGHLVELMVYQLAVVGVLMLVDWRRSWPELPTIALLATWMLGGRWAAVNLGDDNGGVFMVWSVVLLIASAASGWRLLQVGADAADQRHAHARLLIAGVLTWAASVAAFWQVLPTLALVTLGLGCWHAFLAVLLVGRLGAAEVSAISRVFVGFAWVQAMAAGPLMLTDGALTLWWIGMSVVAVVLPWSGIRQLRPTMILMPTIGAIVSVISFTDPREAPALALGMLAALVPLGASLWSHDRAKQDGPDPMLWFVAAFSWVAVVVELGPKPPQLALLWGLVPVIVLVVWVCVRLTQAGARLASLALCIGLIGAIVATVAHELVDPPRLTEVAHASGRSLIVMALIGLAGLALGLIWRIVQAKRLEQLEHDSEVAVLGIIVALALGGSLGLVMSIGVVALGIGPSLAQLGYTLAAATTGLGLLVAGLRLRQSTWRQVGLAAIGIAAIKVVGVDLASAAVVWRALGFAGIGVILIGGAYAYSRAQQRFAGAATLKPEVAAAPE